MADELSELDELIESDVLEALGEKVAEDSSIEIDGITIEDLEPLNETEATPEDDTETETQETESVEEDITTSEIEDLVDMPTGEESDEVLIEDLETPIEEPEIALQEETQEKTVTSTDLATLLSELLNNKTIEITIKVKD